MDRPTTSFFLSILGPATTATTTFTGHVRSSRFTSSCFDPSTIPPGSHRVATTGRVHASDGNRPISDRQLPQPIRRRRLSARRRRVQSLPPTLPTTTATRVFPSSSPVRTTIFSVYDVSITAVDDVESAILHAKSDARTATATAAPATTATSRATTVQSDCQHRRLEGPFTTTTTSIGYSILHGIFTGLDE